ncbi:glycosyltransferase [Mesorhizobium sp. BAC0120]|uniref:glycosyltransferase n=1 Tax=Mesorhizobium sp. BAC0120 TaxID=3090670 RepID=UPI00298CE8EA|nr:glycosyltransferase [Mesorhizobium sp. BAC0120]MDW6022555.1 glycosyltransferase [Mesorhizobium sp. BAC0120]
MIRRMRIGFVVGEFPLLSHTFVISQIEGFMRRGYDISVICDRIGSDRRIDATAEPMKTMLENTHRWWRLSSRLRSAVGRLPPKLQDKVSTAADMLWTEELNRCDLLLAHFGNNGLRLARAKKQKRLAPPIVTIFHGNDVGIPAHEGTLQRYMPLFQHGTCQLTVNEVFRRQLIEVGAPEHQVAVHRMGIDCDDIPYHPRNMDEGPLRLISVCRLVEKKGIAFALRAVAALQAAEPQIEWRYSVIGDGPLLDELRALAGELGIEERVRFYGALPHGDVKEHLARSHIFLLPSVTATDGDVEGVPVALMEAMAAGLITVSTYHSGIPELIENHKTGFLAPEKDVEALATHLIWIAENRDASHAVTAAARRHIEAEFNNDVLNDRLATMITSLLAEKQVA